ncbi:dTDP-4-amino-4,6-dideoxygalactose transaminase [Stutzerimonas zhaodongensis]|uniref:dTDP-4-amino-4,6-dideoxygalactose transaminase n=1 Tax=Stutzerimonas TaxID=2901164 RepID=UPI00388D6EF1
MIPFNKPYLHGRELVYIAEAVASGKIAGDGSFTRRCHKFFEERYGIKKALLTTSCTDALEMCALLLDIKEGDEVILPSFTFVSTANAFAMHGARLVFADSCDDNPNISVYEIERLITARTRAIIVVHYAGVACDMTSIMALAERHGIVVIEDAAHAVEATFNGRPLGTIGALATFSFHETKNIISGEGGMLAINDDRFSQRAEVIREKGTNRSAFFRGEIDKYNWVDVGSSYLPSDIIAAYLYAQVEVIDAIQAKRIAIWQRYNTAFSSFPQRGIGLPTIPQWGCNNAHMYYLLMPDIETRTALINALKQEGILAVFHYQPLHLSPYYGKQHGDRALPNSVRFSDTLVRMPIYYELTDQQQGYIIERALQAVHKLTVYP